MRVEVEIGMIEVEAATGGAEPGALSNAVADAVTAHLREAGIPNALGDRRTGERNEPAAQTGAIRRQLAAEILKGMPR